jgi:hypothetical protein
VKQAAKVAAAGAAVGAAAAAARVLTKHDNDDDSEPEPQGSREEARAEQQDEETERPGPDRDEEPRQERQPQPGADSQSETEEPPPGASVDESQGAVRAAREQLETLLGRSPESVSALERTHEGWLVTVEVVEVSRVPESTDVLASYEIELDGNSNLRRYARVRRYHRSQADHGGAA